MIEQDDLKIIEECLGGNTEAFEQIVDKYQKPIFNGAYRIINQYEDAEDVTQAVFVKAFENLRSFNPKYKFFSWLYRMLINESLNFINHRKRIEISDTETMRHKLNPQENHRAIDLSRDIQNALMDLKPDYRVVVVLKHFRDFSYKEMSTVLDIPEKTVKSRLFTARQALKDILVRKGFISNG